MTRSGKKTPHAGGKRGAAKKTGAARKSTGPARKRTVPTRKRSPAAVHHLTLEQYERLKRKADRARKRALLKHKAKAAKQAAVRAGKIGIVPAATPLPALFDPADSVGRRLATAVRAQPDDDERCTAYAVGAAIEAFWCRRENRPDAAPHISVQDIFERAGAEVDRAVDVASAGVVDERCWPPGKRKCADPKADSWKGKFRLMDEPLDRMPEAMCRALVERGPLVITIPIFKNFGAFVGNGAYRPKGEQIGAHAVCVVGYERVGSSGVWIVKNSYGTAWGDNGYARFRWRDEHLDPEHVVYAVDDIRHPAT
jgi:hypothetical protein